MTIQVLFFAQARERAGTARTSLEIEDGTRVRDALALIAKRHPELADLMPHLAVALDRQLVGPDTLLAAGAELALLPPVSGGSPARPQPAAKPRRRLGLEVLPVTPERWGDLEKLFGPRGACAGCWCMWPRLIGKEFRAGKGAGNRRRLQRLVKKGPPPGLIGYASGEPVAWCALAPREAYARIENSRTLARVDEAPVWSVPCFFVARGHRRQGLTALMLRAAVAYAKRAGARILEGYPVDPGGTTADAFAWWGLVPAFERAGFTEVARRSRTHPVMRRVLKRGTRG